MATVLTNAGAAALAGLLSGDYTGIFNRIGWGTGAGTAAKTDTTLFTEAGEARITGTRSRMTTTVTNDTYRVQGTMTNTTSTGSNTQTITNAGVLDAATGGTLGIHGDHAGIPTGLNDTVAYDFRLVQVN